MQPASRDRLLGREDELALIEHSLDQGRRLVVITGIGGIGKSTLAMAALDAARASRVPVIPVWLESAHDEEDVVDELGGMLGVSLHGKLGERIARVAARLERMASPLVLFDAFESVLHAGVTVVDRLLVLVPGLRVLITTREWSEGGRGVVIRLGPLAVGSDDALGIELFRRRAPIALGHEPSTVSAIRRIVAGVDGIPLAIEFAAARTAILSLDDLAERVASDLGLLAQPGRMQGHRQATMRRVLDWSWQLLPEAAQHVLMMLSSLRGPFGIFDVEGVVGREGADVVDALQSLVQACMVHLVDPDGHRGPTYRLLMPIRGFTAHKLREAGLEPMARAQHRRWFLDGIEPDDEVWLRALDRHLDLLDARRAEFDRICEDDFAPIHRLRASIRRLCARDKRSLPLRNLARLEQVTRLVDPDARCRRTLLVAHLLLTEFAYKTGQPERMRAFLDRAEALCDDGDDVLRCRLQLQRAAMCNLEGDLDGARAWFHRAHSSALASGEPCCSGLAASGLAIMLGPDDPRSATLGRQALAFAEASGSSAVVWRVAAYLGELRVTERDSPERVTLLERAYEAAMRSGMRQAMHLASLHRALFRYQQGDVGGAIEDCQPVVDDTEHGFHPGLAGHVRLFLGFMLHHVQAYEEAARRYAAAARLLEGTHSGAVARWAAAFLARERGARDTPWPDAVPPGPEGRIIRAWHAAVTRDAPLTIGALVVDNTLPDGLLRLARVACARRRPPADALLLGPKALRAPDGAWVSTARWRVQRALLDVLVDAHIKRPGQALSYQEIVAEVWPDERRPMSDSSRNRMHVLLNSLRRAGLAAHIETVSDGWRLSPGLKVVLVDDGPSGPGQPP